MSATIPSHEPHISDNVAALLFKLLGAVAPCPHHADVTPHDTNELAHATRLLYVGSDGLNVKVQTIHGEDVTYKLVPAGTFIPVEAKKVYATGTTATDIVAMW